MTTQCRKPEDHNLTPRREDLKYYKQDELVGSNQTVTFSDFPINITYDTGLTDKREVSKLWVSKTM
jgi:hypothetical protein